MKTEKEIFKEIKRYTDLLLREYNDDKICINRIQKRKIEVKIEALKWVLELEEEE